jgi:murein DD-endopeptidase MepM/ murein hydrolase activator NlpD
MTVAAGALAAEPPSAGGTTSVPQPIRRRDRRAAAPEVVPSVDEPAEVAEPDIADEVVAEPAAVETSEVVVETEPAPLLETVLAPAEPFELIEPRATIEPEQATSEPGEPSVELDEFERAARLFAFTGELPVQVQVTVEQHAAATAHSVPRGARAARGSALTRVAAASFSVGVMGIVGLLTVGMTTPAEAVAAASGAETSVSVIAPEEPAAGDVAPEDEIQAYVAPAGAENADVTRSENYSTATMAELAYESGISNVSNFFVNDPNSAIQWPFAVGVPISYGFGMRSGVLHEGVDFTPGAGSPIQAIADGTVRVATNAGGAYGVHVIIDHVIDGELVSSHYAHLQYGSLQVQVGQKVTVATVLGRTGNTGRSYGAHTHFEILMGGTTPIDPIPWLRQHAGG